MSNNIRVISRFAADDLDCVWDCQAVEVHVNGRCVGQFTGNGGKDGTREAEEYVQGLTAGFGADNVRIVRERVANWA